MGTHDALVVVDDDPGLLILGVGVEPRVGGDPRLRLALGQLLLGLGLELVELLVGRVVAQHVEDEALLDGLAHRVDVKRHVGRVAVGGRRTEQLERAALGRGGEGEVADVGLLAAGRHLCQQLGRHAVGLIGVEVEVLHGARADHRLEVDRRLAGLRGVRLVDDDRVAPVLQRLGAVVAGELAQHEGELLQRGDDDLRRLAAERLEELPGVLVDLHHRGRGLCEGAHLALKLGVEHAPVGDDDDLVEDQPAVVVVQRREVVGQPGDLLALARAGGVLDEVALPGAVDAGVRGAGAHDVPLVVAREDDAARRPVALVEDEVVQQLQPRVALPHLLPDVGGGVAVVAGERVAHPAVGARSTGALIEGQKAGALPGQAGGHVGEVAVQREVHERALDQQGVARVTVVAVLADGLLHVPAGGGVLVLQLRGGGREAVDEQDEVERVLRAPGVVVDLAHDREPVGLVQGEARPIGLQVGTEVAQAKGDALLGDPVADQVDRPALGELRGDALEESLPCSGLPTGVLGQLVPRLALRVAHEGDEVVGVQRELLVVALRVSLLPSPGRREVPDDQRLEPGLGVVEDGHQTGTSSRRPSAAAWRRSSIWRSDAAVTSSLPVTASWMREER